MADYSNLKERASEIRTEVKIGANTADRVGSLLEEIVKAIEAEGQRPQQKLNTYHENGTDAVSIATQKNILLNTTSADGGKVSELYLSTEEAVALIRVVSSAGTSLFRVDGGALTIQLPTSISINVPSLNLGNVRRIYGAYVDGLQTSGDININAKTRISATVDTGELKVLQGASNYGFILRTVTDPNNTAGLDLVELLSTDGYNSRKYTFPAQSGEVALKSDIPDVSGKQDRLRRYTEGEISINGTTETRATTVADRVTLQNASNGATRISCRKDAVGATYSGEEVYADMQLSENGLQLQAISLTDEEPTPSSIVLRPDGVMISGRVDIAGEHSNVNINGEVIQIHYRTNSMTGLTVSEEYVSVASTDGANGAVVDIDDSVTMQAYDASGNSSMLILSPDGANLEAKSMRIYSIDRAVGSAEINVSPTGVSIAGASLNLANVPKVENARFLGLQTDGDINIKGKTRIAHNIDSGELKVLHNTGNDGFILRTVRNPNNTSGLYLIELLSTDGYNSYKYTFPAQSGEVALKAELDALKARVAALEAKH